MNENFKCVDCGLNDVDHEGDLCDSCFYIDAEEDEDLEEEEE
jgi:NMD protein affecting ribosome stability and mRNA decay